jgi:hypothetical protein
LNAQNSIPRFVKYVENLECQMWYSLTNIYWEIWTECQPNNVYMYMKWHIKCQSLISCGSLEGLNQCWYGFVFLFSIVQVFIMKVRDDLKLRGDYGEVTILKWSGWQFDS